MPLISTSFRVSVNSLRTTSHSDVSDLMVSLLQEEVFHRSRFHSIQMLTVLLTFLLRILVQDVSSISLSHPVHHSAMRISREQLRKLRLTKKLIRSVRKVLRFVTMLMLSYSRQRRLSTKLEISFLMLISQRLRKNLSHLRQSSREQISITFQSTMQRSLRQVVSHS